mmetsp:Transcript_89731/g.240568  ORF Transcript_89731/g.240568 Transcript_89731/m.240568 type:complete len:269 (+) Transcript_89731:24-830(+)
MACTLLVLLLPPVVGTHPERIGSCHPHLQYWTRRIRCADLGCPGDDVQNVGAEGCADRHPLQRSLKHVREGQSEAADSRCRARWVGARPTASATLLGSARARITSGGSRQAGGSKSRPVGALSISVLSWASGSKGQWLQHFNSYSNLLAVTAWRFPGSWDGDVPAVRTLSRASMDGCFNGLDYTCYATTLLSSVLGQLVHSFPRSSCRVSRWASRSGAPDVGGSSSDRLGRGGLWARRAPAFWGVSPVIDSVASAARLGPHRVKLTSA